MIYHYDLEGRLLAESTETGAMLADYVYINGIPFAKINGSTINFYHVDHLGSPQVMTNSSGDIVWDGEFLPFGEPFSISGAITNNLRFPGQYFDLETGLHQNYFRDYDPKTGKYIQADPIGTRVSNYAGADSSEMKGVINVYTYVGNNPITLIDPFGLTASCPARQQCIDGAVKTRTMCTRVAWASEGLCVSVCAVSCAAVPGYLECLIPCATACHTSFVLVRRWCWGIFFTQLHVCCKIKCDDGCGNK